jgi:hypothetical protein
LNPKKLQPFYTAFENKRRLRDEENWFVWGTYGMSAFSVILANAFGKGSNAKYIEKPLYKNSSTEQKEVLTEEEKIKQTEMLFMQLEIMGANHKLQKNK